MDPLQSRTLFFADWLNILRWKQRALSHWSPWGPLGPRLALSTHQVQVIQALGDMARHGIAGDHSDKKKLWKDMTSLAMIWKDVKRCGLFVSKFSNVFGLLREMDHLLRKSKAKVQENEESKGPNEPPKSRVPSWGWQTVEAFVIRSWAKRAASSYFGETHLIFPMAENKIWGLPCAVLPKKCPIRISRISFLSQLFNKKFAVSESMSYPVWLSHEDAEIQYPPVYPSKGGSLLTSGVSPVFGHTLWTHPWNLQKNGGSLKI